MIEYVSVEKLVDAHIRAEKDPYTMGWNDGIQNALEKKNITRAVPEEAFEVVKKLLEGWKNETRYKKELAIADHDTATADIKRTEENAFGFALQVLERLERYGEEDGEVTCSDN
jgi:hypothetical protein